MKRFAVVLGALFCCATAFEAKAARQEGWPCIQRKVPKLTAGAFWSGPAFDENAPWRDDADVAALVAELVSRRTPLEKADKLIADFAAKQGAEKQAKLALLFTGVFNEINTLRSDIIRGIERFMKNQQAKSDQLQKARAELDALDAKPDKTEADLKRLAELQTTVQWLIRIYDDREGTLTYVCETPVLLEQRLFALSRAIQSHLG